MTHSVIGISKVLVLWLRFKWIFFFFAIVSFVFLSAHILGSLEWVFSHFFLFLCVLLVKA